ncbi:hypothetical protein ACWEOO_23630 [Kribbella sp. NPDC004138]
MSRWTAGLATLVTAVTPALTAWGTAPAPRLTADVNRDGLLTRADDAGKSTWTDTRGAIFLPNLDDDERRCTVDPDQRSARHGRARTADDRCPTQPFVRRDRNCHGHPSGQGPRVR